MYKIFYYFRLSKNNNKNKIFNNFLSFMDKDDQPFSLRLDWI